MANQSAGGGIVRDDQGKGILAYAANFGTGSNMYAEAMTLLLGLKDCRDNRLMLSCVECNSKALVDCINGISKVPWAILSIVREWNAFLQGSHLSHLYREGNRLADALSITDRSYPSVLFSAPLFISSLSFYHE